MTKYRIQKYHDMRNSSNELEIYYTVEHQSRFLFWKYWTPTARQYCMFAGQHYSKRFKSHEHANHWLTNWILSKENPAKTVQKVEGNTYD